MSQREEILLTIDDLKTYFRTGLGEVKAVDGVNLTLQKGKTLGIIGESGCGKTVTSLSIMRLIKPPSGRIAAGQVVFQGRNLLDLTESEMRTVRGNSIGMIFQEPMTSLNPVFRIGDQIMETLIIHRKLSQNEARERTLDLLSKVGIPSPNIRIDEYPHQMSGGMKQRAMIGMAIACNPQVLIADEPTTALDVTMQAQIIDLLYQLQNEMGMSILLITHDLGIIAEMAHQVAVMYASKVVEQSSVEGLFQKPLHPYTLGLFHSLPRLGGRGRSLEAIRGQVPNPLNFPSGCKFWPRCSYADQRCREQEPVLERVDSDRLVACWRVNEHGTDFPQKIKGKPSPPEDYTKKSGTPVISGRDVTGLPKKEQSIEKQIDSQVGVRNILEVKGLKKFFPVKRGFWGRTSAWVKAVDGVSLRINHGETVGLVGESGCGKTTVGRTILRLMEPTSGEVLFEGTPLYSLKGEPLRKIRQKMQIIFQDPYSSLNPRLTVGYIVGEALSAHGIARGRERKTLVENLFVKVGLSPSYLNRYPHEFSGGQRQRIGIARALALNPQFIVCDEAVSALDVSIQAQIINLLQKLQEELHLSYLFIAHNLAVVEHISHKVAIMYLGQIVEQLPAHGLVKNAVHPYTQALLSSNPVTDPSLRGRHAPLSGDVPSPINLPPGCRFYPRCPLGQKQCLEQCPELTERDKDHWVRCWVR
ncbi:MAG: ABC transporter ATP-binding protein [bacterium]